MTNLVSNRLDVAALESRLASELERWLVPGLELAVVRGDDTLYAGGVGQRDLVRGRTVTPRTLFHHGSTGKAFTGVLVASLVDEGLLEWDRPVQDYLPELKLPDPLATEAVTIRDLLGHRSGLARHDLAWMSNPSWSRDELIMRLRHLEPMGHARVGFVYSNFGYVTLGHVVGSVTQSTWEEQLRVRILKPLGMDSTVTSIEAAETSDDHARPHVVRDGKAAEVPFRRSDPIAPAGGVISCAEDSARWLRFQLGDGEFDGKRVLSQESFSETRTIQTPFHHPAAEGLGMTYGYGMGWEIGTYRERKSLTHAGGIDGFSTQILILPDDGIGVLTSNNQHLCHLATAVMYNAADLVLEVEPRPWFDELFEMTKPLRAKNEEAGSAPRVDSDNPPSRPIQDFEGEYEHPGYGLVHITVVANTDLSMRLGDLELSAIHRHFDTWTALFTDLQGLPPLAATFVTNSEGNVAALEIPLALDPTLHPVRFRRL